MIQIKVTGTPAPQGSHRGFVVNGRAVITQDNKKTKPWRQDVKAAALNAIADHVITDLDDATPYTGPLHVTIVFSMPRPGYHFGSGRNANHLKPSAPTFVDKKPDIDKLGRATLDALTEAGIWRDDSQVAELTLSKTYATGTPPGAVITVVPLNAVPAPSLAQPSPGAGTAPSPAAASTSTPDAAAASIQEALL